MDQRDQATADDERALVPRRERVVEFYGDPILAVQGADDTVYVPLRPICEHLGLAWNGQFERIQRDEVLSDVVRSVRVTRTEAGAREVLCLPLEYLPGWLFGVNAARVKPALHEKIVRYRRECFRVLWNAFQADVLPAGPPSTGLSAAQQTLELANAIQRMAQQQVDLEGRLDQVANRQDVMAGYLRGFIRDTQTRLSHLELSLSPTATISEAQAAEIALAVKQVSSRLAAAGDRTGYQQVYAEIYRRYGLSSYKNLPAGRCAEVLAWLQAWYEELAPS